MLLEEYQPVSTLIVPEHHPAKARYPFIDVHNHHNVELSDEALNQTCQEMDALNLAVMVNLSGGYGSTLLRRVEAFSKPRGRFITFANITFSQIAAPEYSHLVAAQFEKDVRHGAQGLKIFKNFGMDLMDANGERIHVDDSRFDELFKLCAHLKTPVLIHTADPKPFFDPADRYNERWLELRMYPARVRSPLHYPCWQTIMDEQSRLFAKHPSTTFINAHLGWRGGDLDDLGRLLDNFPNVYTDIAAVLAELGRQPRHAHKWFTRYQDRVLFGKDNWEPREYHTYFRVLETADEYFDYYRPTHGLWKMYGLELPDDVLRKLYYKNALRLLPGIDPSPFPCD